MFSTKRTNQTWRWKVNEINNNVCKILCETIKEKICELFKSHVEVTDKNIVFNDTMGFKQQIHEAYTSHFIEMIDECIDRNNKSLYPDNLDIISQNVAFNILKSKLMEVK